MKRTATTLSLAFLLIFGVFAYTQEPSEKESQKQEEQKPEARPEEARPQKQEEPRPEETKPSKPSKSENPKHEEQPAKQEGTKRSHEEHGQATTAPQGRASKSARIPEEKFRASFGRQHTFVISRPIIVESRPRFQFAGFWFEIIDPWPAGWAFTDDCFIDFIDGEYFLFDLLHPGERVVVFVVE